MRKKILASIGAAALIAGGGTLLGTTVASAAGGGDHQATESGYHVCVNPDSTIKRNAIYPNDAAHPFACYNGAQLYSWLSKQNVNGHFRSDESALNAVAKSLAGTQSDVGDLQTRLAQAEEDITALQSGKQNVPVSVNANTSVVNWPETSGWATDKFVRAATVTRGDSAPNSKCNGAATCWAYTFTLVDEGSFIGVEGAKSPADPSITITGTPQGDMQGSAEGTFYSSSNAPDPSLVGASQDGRGNLSTTSWAQQFFPEGTTFGFDLTTYKWIYTSNNSCTEAGKAESWTDAINPGDDGADPTVDGNITGTRCLAPPAG